MGGSALGVGVIESADDLPRAVVDAYTYGEVALIEQRVRGVEVSVGIIDLGDGPFALPLVEIEPRSGVYSYEARYNAAKPASTHPLALLTMSQRPPRLQRSRSTEPSDFATSRAST